jgi:hypothetical protein
VKFGLESGELTKRIKERGIDFDPTDDYLETLRKAGAQEAVVHALREARLQPLSLVWGRLERFGIFCAMLPVASIDREQHII